MRCYLFAVLMVAGCGMPSGQSAEKLPHLLVTATGEDLGVYLGEDCAWNEALDGEVCFGPSQPPTYFENVDCTGAAYYQTPDLEHATRLRFGIKAELLKVNVATKMAAVQSAAQWILDGPAPKCTAFPAPDMRDWGVLTDTGVLSRFVAHADLSVDFR